jgi:topoisomerase IA-like protein
MDMNQKLYTETISIISEVWGMLKGQTEKNNAPDTGKNAFKDILVSTLAIIGIVTEQPEIEIAAVVVAGVWDYLSPIINRIEGGLAIAGSIPGTGKSRTLGYHPETGNEILTKRTRNGWTLVEQNKDNNKDSRFANLGLYNPDTITLEEAVPLLVWPKNLGVYRGNTVYLNKRNNVYITCDGKHYSVEGYESATKQQLPAHDTVDLNTAIAIITYFNTPKVGGAGDTSSSSPATITTDIKFDGVDDYLIKKGPYGYYIKYLNMYNVPLPANVKKDISLATKENCDAIIKNYLSNKGQVNGLNDVKIKTPAPTTKKVQPLETSTATAKETKPKIRSQKKNVAQEVHVSSEPEVSTTPVKKERKPRTPRVKKTQEP